MRVGSNIQRERARFWKCLYIHTYTPILYTSIMALTPTLGGFYYWFISYALICFCIFLCSYRSQVYVPVTVFNDVDLWTINDWALKGGYLRVIFCNKRTYKRLRLAISANREGGCCMNIAVIQSHNVQFYVDRLKCLLSRFLFFCRRCGIATKVLLQLQPRIPSV